MNQNIKSKEKMGFGSIFLLGVNGIIGSGIFLLPNKMFHLASSYSILLIFLAGLAALFQAACFANLSSGFSGNGAAWLYTYNAFGKFPGFEVGFLSWVQGVITIAAEVAAFVTTLGIMVPFFSNTIVIKITGVIIVLILTILNCFGAKVSKISDNISSMVKLIVLFSFIILCIFSVNISNVTNNFNSMNLENANKSFSLIFYMFAGFSFLPIAANKMKNSEKNLPKALISVILTVALLYALVQVTIIGHLGGKTMHSNLPIADIYNTVIGPYGRLAACIGMLVAIIGVALSVTYSTPYIASSLANEHQLLPKYLGKTTKSGTPYVAIIITSIISMLLVISGSYVFLISCVVFMSVVQYIAVALASMKFHKTTKGAMGTFNGKKMPYGLLIPIVALIFDIYLISGFTKSVLSFGIITIIISIFMYKLMIIENKRR